jgi:hypothetical protein
MRLRPLVVAAVGCALAQIADLISSLGFGPAFSEVNPLSRGLNDSFSFERGFKVKTVAFIFFSVMSAFIYYTLRPWDKHRAEVIATSPYLYFGISAIVVALDNTLLHFS